MEKNVWKSPYSRLIYFIALFYGKVAYHCQGATVEMYNGPMAITLFWRTMDSHGHVDVTLRACLCNQRCKRKNSAHCPDEPIKQRKWVSKLSLFPPPSPPCHCRKVHHGGRQSHIPVVPNFCFPWFLSCAPSTSRASTSVERRYLHVHRLDSIGLSF